MPVPENDECYITKPLRILNCSEIIVFVIQMIVLEKPSIIAGVLSKWVGLFCLLATKKRPSC